MKIIITLLTTLLLSPVTSASEQSLLDRVIALEERITQLEELVEVSTAKNRWKDPILWKRIKKDFSPKAIETLLGKPERIEEQIFTTWYYNPSTKLKGFIWFDEGKVLGWEAPD